MKNIVERPGVSPLTTIEAVKQKIDIEINSLMTKKSHQLFFE